jgi:hypothetical protein
MTQKTIISHFYNEEYLLPWWLEHHKRFFDHGILIDYNSTDRSCDIIRSICPNWSIVQSTNQYFDSAIIDKEVQHIESKISGWRICLNTTEFLVGDYSVLDNLINYNYQFFLGNYVFVDNTLTKLNPRLPLYKQIQYGFHEDSTIAARLLDLGHRSLRSIHNTKISYPKQGGRHFIGPESIQNLFIFYYGYILNVDQMIQRKLQIQNKMSSREISSLRSRGDHPNIVTEDSFKNRIIKHQLSRCKDLTLEIDRIIGLQENYAKKKNSYISYI